MSSKRNGRVSKACGAIATAGTVGLVTGLAAGPASAAVTVSIGTVTVPAGSATTALVGVFASSNSGDVISGFNLPFDYNNDGFVDRNGDGVGDLPAGFSLGGPLVRNALYPNNTAFDMPQQQDVLANVDGIPTGSGANVTLGTTPTRLFDLAINVAATVPAGTVLPFEIEVPAAPFNVLFNVAGPNAPTVAAPTAGSPVFGSLRVTAVPEPATAAALAAAGVALLGRRRRAVR